MIPDEMQENLESSSEKLSYTSLPEYFKNLSSEELSTSKRKGENRKSFGNMRKDIPAIKIRNIAGQLSYTIAVKKLPGDSQSLYFDNLVITELEKNRKKYTILHYLPKAEWYNSSTRDLKDFSGTIEFYTVTGEYLGKLSLLHGEGIEEPEENKGYSTTCTYKSTSFCSGETTQNGDVSGGSYSCVYNITENCTTTYTNDSPTYTNEEETIEQCNSGGGGGITTTPVPD